MRKKNKVERISLTGGLIGLLTTDPRKALDDLLTKGNQDQWNAIEIIPHATTNRLVMVIQFLILLMTLGIWTWGGGYLVLFEKDA